MRETSIEIYSFSSVNKNVYIHTYMYIYGNDWEIKLTSNVFLVNHKTFLKLRVTFKQHIQRLLTVTNKLLLILSKK